MWPRVERRRLAAAPTRTRSRAARSWRRRAPVRDTGGGRQGRRAEAGRACHARARLARAGGPSAAVGEQLESLRCRIAAARVATLARRSVGLARRGVPLAAARPHAMARSTRGSHARIAGRIDIAARPHSCTPPAQMVYAAVGDDMPLIHALSIQALAPGEAGA